MTVVNFFPVIRKELFWWRGMMNVFFYSKDDNRLSSLQTEKQHLFLSITFALISCVISPACANCQKCTTLNIAFLPSKSLVLLKMFTFLYMKTQTVHIAKFYRGLSQLCDRFGGCDRCQATCGSSDLSMSVWNLSQRLKTRWKGY